MKDIVGVVLFSACLNALAPITKSKAIRSALTLLMGVAVLTVICAPLGSAANSVRDFPQYIAELIKPAQEEITNMESDSQKWVIRYGVKNVERGIQQLIVSRFSLSSGTIYVETDTAWSAEGEVSIEGIRVYMLNGVQCDDTAVELYVSDMLACPCKVIRGEVIIVE